ncbi:MAG: flagellar biosynthetic protein FliO [Pseudomonadota bacterium]
MIDATEILKVLLALAAVVALVLLLAAGAQVWRRNRGLLGDQDLEVLSTASVGPKERVVLLKVRERELLLGVSAHQVRTLAELPQATELRHE